MGEFSLYIRYRSDAETDETAAELLDRFVEEYESVSYESESIDAETEPGVIVPENGLDVSDIEAFASVFSELRDHPAVHDISLWGPGSERYPVRVYHHALQSLSDPDRYQFHAIDNRETLLICDTPAALNQARQEIGPAGLVEGGTAKF
jgi:hypothetical protein